MASIKGDNVGGWDARIFRYWSEALEIDEAVFGKRGLVLHPSPDADEYVIVNTIGTLQIVMLPPRFEGLVQAGKRDFPSLEAMAEAFHVSLTPKWRDFVSYATTPSGAGDLPEHARLLTANDADLLVGLQAECTADELALSVISIDDPLAVGYFDGERLVGVVSLLEKGHDIDDIGVLTHPDYRGRGIGARLTTYLRNDIVRRGRIAQYITMETNQGSVRISEKCQFRLFVVEAGYDVTAV